MAALMFVAAVATAWRSRARRAGRTIVLCRVVSVGGGGDHVTSSSLERWLRQIEALRRAA